MPRAGAPKNVVSKVPVSTRPGLVVSPIRWNPAFGLSDRRLKTQEVQYKIAINVKADL
jgi:hypothetical protein